MTNREEFLFFPLKARPFWGRKAEVTINGDGDVNGEREAVYKYIEHSSPVCQF